MSKALMIYIGMLVAGCTTMAASLVVYNVSSSSIQAITTSTPARLPISTVSESPVPTITPSPVPTLTPPLPSQVDYTVPFAVQAPRGQWDSVHEELCEETAVLMIMAYFNHQDLTNPDVAEQSLQAIKDFETKIFGFYEDTTAAQTARIIQEYYHYNKVQLITDPTVNNIKEAVAAGKLVIAPTAGQQLGNPHFTPPGPLYHMVVIKGYTADKKFIVNDPGTKYGADYQYDQTVLLNAIHDWRPDRQINQGAKIILIIG